MTATVGNGLLLAARNPVATARRERWLPEAEKTQGDWPTAQDTILLGIRHNCTFVFKK